MSRPLSTADTCTFTARAWLGGELGQLEVVRGEQREGLGCGRAGGWRWRGQRQAVEGAGAAADLVHQHQAAVGGAVHDGAASVISSMKVDCALARSSAAPMRVWMASIGPAAALAAGTKSPCRQQHDQRHLAHEGALAAHVGAGDDQHAVSWRPAGNVVGDEGCRRRFVQPRSPPPGGGRPRCRCGGRGDELGRHQFSVAARSASAASASSARAPRQRGQRRRCGCSASSNCSYSHFSRASARSAPTAPCPRRPSAPA